MDTSQDGSAESVLTNLRTYISEIGGQIHQDIEIRAISDDNRGVFARNAIAKGNLLISLPIAISGKDFPTTYKDGKKQVSPWLRCLAAFWEAPIPYLESLPSFFETLSEWSPQEVEDYLLGSNSQDGTAWKAVDPEWMKERYHQQVRPFLYECGLVDDDEDPIELARFGIACQCLSTRAFHLAGSDTTVDTDYNGPFLLPLIDMLNHSVERKCTTLQRNDRGFLMIAERDIVPGEEILHSYGDDLTAAQFLQTFGFVPTEILQKCYQPSDETSCPVIFRHEEIVQACWKVIESGFPDKLAHCIPDDETWEVKIDRARPYSNNTMLAVDGDLSDELVTISCLPFLPESEYQEVAAEESLEGSMLLEDTFLAHLACLAILEAIRNKQKGYETVVKSDSLEKDQALLKELMLGQDDADDRFAYGLAVCIQEKKCLGRTRRKALEVLARFGVLEENELEQATKRARTE